MPRIFAALALFLALIALASSAEAASQKIRNTCASGADLDAVIKACTQLIAAKDTNQNKSIVFYNRASAYVQKGDYDSAIADDTRAIELDPKNAYAFIDRSGAYYYKREYDLSIADSTRAIELNPNASEAYVNRGAAYRGKRDFDHALADLNRALELNPKHETALYNRGGMYLDKGDYEHAIADLTRSIALNPKAADARAQRAVAFLKTGKFDLARADLDKALELKPDYPEAKAKLAELEQAEAGATKSGGSVPIATPANVTELQFPSLTGRVVDSAEILSRDDEQQLNSTLKAIEDKTSDQLVVVTIASLQGRTIEDYSLQLGRHWVIGGTEGKGVLLVVAPNERKTRIEVGTGLSPVLTDELSRTILDEAILPKFRSGAYPAGIKDGVDKIVSVLARGDASPEVTVSPAQQEAVEPTVNAATVPAAPVSPPAAVPLGKRVALVIGNATYAHTAALGNPDNDAADVAAALQRLGFTVIFEHDLDKRGMDDTFRRFAREVKGADVALFYYAGHAMQFEGVNYLMPVDAKLADEADVPYEMAKLDDVVADMARMSGVRIAVLDACRNNPLEEQLKRSVASTRGVSPTRGLARIARPEGLIVAYSTQSGNVAEDGSGRNSPFTAALLQHIETPGLEVGTLFRRVMGSVKQATSGKQHPELSVLFDGEFYFKPGS